MTIGQYIPVNPIAPAFAATTWDGASFYAGASPSVTVTVLTSPSVAYTPQWSSDGTNWFPMSGLDLNFNIQTSIGTAFTGPIAYQGGGWVRLNGGSGGTFLISGGQYAAIAAALPAGTNNIGAVGGTTARVSANFTRPANTTAYTAPSGTTPGSLVANSTTAASVVPMSITGGRLSSGSGASGSVLRGTLQKSSTTLTNAMFRVHLYSAPPATITNGDGGTWNTSGSAAYLGKIDIAMDEPFTDGALGTGVPFSGGAINFASQTIYAVIEARGAYTPASGETFTLTLEVAQN